MEYEARDLEFAILSVLLVKDGESKLDLI